jgi:TRAP transporter TAXI family solute receptor
MSCRQHTDGPQESGENMKRSRILLLALGLAAAGCSHEAATFVTIGTGGVTGVYYPTGGAISRMVNRKFDTYGIKATVESTSGSVFNINGVVSGDLEFGVAQSDRQYQAWHGLAEWAGRGPQTDLRSVFSVYPEAITLVASDASGIREIGDLRDKRVNLGNPGSGQLQNSKDVFAAVGIGEDEISAEYVKAVEAPALLQDGRIDAFFYTVGHPAGNIKEATSGRLKVRLIPIVGPAIREMIKDRPYYAEAVIPHEFYENALNDEDVPTVGVKATFVTSRNVAADIVYAVTREVFENLDDFRELHPAYKSLSAPDMLRGLSAPIHAGALRYYRESGLIEYVDPKLIVDQAG